MFPSIHNNFNMGEPLFVSNVNRRRKLFGIRCAKISEDFKTLRKRVNISKRWTRRAHAVLFWTYVFRSRCFSTREQTNNCVEVYTDLRSVNTTFVYECSRRNVINVFICCELFGRPFNLISVVLCRHTPNIEYEPTDFKRG